MQPERRARIRVVKVGGSLLDLPDLGERLDRYLTDHPVRLDVLIVGGGAIVDALRRLDQVHGLGEETAHWLSIDALSLTAGMLHRILPETILERRFERVVKWCRDRTAVPSSTTGHPSPGRDDGLESAAADAEPRRVVFDPSGFLRHDEPRRAGISLPHGWHVTSDSIAARVCELLRADELVLLKSVAVTPHATWQELAAQQIVDGYFPQAAKRLPRVTLKKLR